MPQPSRKTKWVSVPCPVCRQAMEIDSSARSGEVACPACETPFWIRKEDDEAGTIATLPLLSLTIGSAADKSEVIAGALHLLATIGLIPADREANIRAAVLEREELGSTGIGNGFAIPHTSRGDVEHPVVAIVRLSAGVPFGGFDPRPVQLLGLAVCPAGRPDEYLASLELISDYLHSQLAEDDDRDEI